MGGRNTLQGDGVHAETQRLKQQVRDLTVERNELARDNYHLRIQNMHVLTTMEAMMKRLGISDGD